MRRALCLLAVLFGSWSTSFGQSAPKLTTPRILATFERLGLTAELPPTTIYRPKHWGTFRISIVMVCTETGGQAGGYRAEIAFTDGAGINEPPPVTLDTGITQTAEGEFPIRAKAGKPIILTVAPFSNTQGTKYNVWVVVEQLM